MGGAPLPGVLLSWPFGWSLLPLPANPSYELWLRRIPAQTISPPTPPRRSAVGVSRWILYFRCPAGMRDRRSSSSCTCDRVRRCCPFAALVFITILRSASDPLHRPREPFSLKLCVFKGELILTTVYPLLASSRFDLGAFVVATVGIFFCFLCNELISGTRAVSMRRCFVRLEHICMWALMIMLLLPLRVLYILVA